MGSSKDKERGATSPATARDGTRVEEASPEALRVPPRDTDPVSGPPDESGVSARGSAGAERATGGDAPRSDVPTPRNAEPAASERSAPTVRRADRVSRGSRPAQPPAESDGSETTLLSAPAPADHFEMDVERRLDETERRLDQLDADLARLAERASPRPERPLAQNPLFWFVFLLAIAVAWLLFKSGH